MNIKNVEVSRADRPPRLAEVVLTLEDSNGRDSLVVSGIVVLQDRRGELRIGMPDRPLRGIVPYKYEEVVEPSRQLERVIEDAVLGAYGKWKESKQQ